MISLNELLNINRTSNEREPAFKPKESSDLKSYFQGAGLPQFASDLSGIFGTIVFHVPHASNVLPESFFKDCQAFDKGKRQHLREVSLKMGDLLLLDLIKEMNPEFLIVAAPYSRIYCDVEKYWDEDKEVMARYGMGAVYRKDCFGHPLHQQTPAFMEEAKAYYETWHNNLYKAVMSTFNQDNKSCLLIDLHSYGAEMADVFGHGPYPDICFGYNKGERNPLLMYLVESYCKAKGLAYKENFPYSGAMTLDKPCPHQVTSLMIEINKRVYL